MNTSVVLVGSYPPPLGGNSVHVMRLYEALRTRGVAARVLDYLGRNESADVDGVHRLTGSGVAKLLGIVRFGAQVPAGSVIHVHVSALGRFKWFAPLLLLLFARHPRVITIHSGSFIAAVKGRWARRYVAWLMRRFHRVITVNEDQRRFLQSLGVPEARVRVIPAFLADESESAEGKALAAALPPDKRIIVTSGYLTRLYNYDVLIDAIDRLPPSDYHFVLAFYNEVDPDYEAELLRRIARHDNVTVLRDRAPAEFLEILRVADVYVRATLTDGDAVAVREALHVGASVLATDVVARPAACRLFAPGDADGLARLLVESGPRGAAAIDGREKDGAELLLGVYREVADAR